MRLGRGLTAYQDSNVAFEPFRGTPSTAGFETDLMVAGYNIQPLDPAGSSANRFSNAVFYNSPMVAGLQLNVTVASKELAGYGRKTPDGVAPTKQIGVGYEYNMSTRKFLYADASQRKAATSVISMGWGYTIDFEGAPRAI